MVNFVMTISGNFLESNIIMDSDFGIINNYQVDTSNDLLLFNDDYIDIINNNINLIPQEDQEDPATPNEEPEPEGDPQTPNEEPEPDS